MKHLRKVMTLVIAAIMALAVSVPALAADPTGSITITGEKYAPQGAQSATYEAYRIFDLTANEDYSSLSYTINEDWAGFFTGTGAGAAYIVAENDETANNGNGYTPIVVDGVVKYIALTDSNIAAFGKAALDYSQKNDIDPTASNTTGEFSDLPLGYYMVYPKGANLNVGDYTSIVSLTTTKPDAEIVQKAEYPTLEKTDSDNSVEVGQKVTYTLTGKVPDTTGYKTFTYIMHDQMTAGLTFDGASSITAVIDNDGTPVPIPATGEGAYTYAAETPDADHATAFGISIPVMKYQDYVGKTITVTYTATVNSNAVIKIDENHATLEYSTDPKNDQDHTTTPPDIEKVFSAKIVIDKYDGSDASKKAKLEGAKFVLRCKSVTDTDEAAQAKVGKYYVADADGKVSWVAEADVDAKVAANNAALESDVKNGATIVTTDDKGAASFDGLENGVYELIEVAAPAGYNQATGVADEVTVNGNDEAVASLTSTSEIANNSGSELPSTGGMGTRILYTVGGIMLVGGAIALVSKKRAASLEK